MTMTASAHAKSSVMTTMSTPASEDIFGPPLNGISQQRLFKKHKVLPHPNKDVMKRGLRESRGLASNPRILKHQSKRIGSSPDLPPTPPAHSRNSSSTHSVPPSSPTYVETPAQSAENVQSKPPSTPTNQMSPPTPDVTPPEVRPERRPKPPVRPVINDRIPSRTTTDSRTESFKTARENPSSDEEEDGKSTLRPVLPSARSSHSTVRQTPKKDTKKAIHPIGLGLGLESSPEASITPRSKREFIAFDGEWGSASDLEVEQEWDDNLDRNVTVRKRRAPAHVNGRRDEVVENMTVAPTNATKALRSMTLPERILTFPSPNDNLERERRKTFIPAAPSTSESSISTDVRRFSGMSSKSTVSTVVEAILVDTPPRRQKTLRHIKKQDILRDSGSDLSPTSSAPTSLLLDEGSRPRRPSARYHEGRHESLVSNSTMNSISSGKARREVWRNGGIPVVIIPDRQSSIKSGSKEPSLRSTSSRRSKRSQSLNSVPLSQISMSKDLTPYFERPSRRSRAASESDGSTPGDQRTIDYPPIVPRRTSSLSAPTSRNASRSASRSGSLKADSIKAQKALENDIHQQPKEPEIKQTRNQPRLPEVKLEKAPSIEALEPVNDHEQHDDQHLHGFSVDRHGDPLFGKRLSAQNTPFSQVSMETTATSQHSQAEVSEATAVTIHPHQNTSVLVVDHSARPSADALDDPQNDLSSRDKEGSETSAVARAQPIIKTTDHDADEPVTPPQPLFSMDDVDSPLRNPRDPPPPPEPPAIKFIPATPSGLTPAYEKQKMLGNYFEEATEKPPSRSASLVRKALGRRRHSSYGPSASRTPNFLTRTFSLTRSIRKETADNASLSHQSRSRAPTYPGPDDAPADDARLHPFWRPASSYHSGDDDDDFVRDVDDETYRYPSIDNRPPPPRRSFSSKMRKTFAILPARDDDDDFYMATSQNEGPDRRTVRRTASGNLRVMKHRDSLDSIRQSADDGRPYTAPDQSRRRRHFWQGHSLSRQSSLKGPGDGRLARILPAISNKIEEYGLHTLPRRLSEKRREKRSKELRQIISGPREVRDGVGDVIRRNNYRDAYTQAQSV